MTLLTAIAKANELRPNAIRDEIKADWVQNLEGDVAEMMEITPPTFSFPDDAELLMPAPHEYIYVYYLCALIAQANEESTLYANDMTVAQSAISEARAWWRRHHRPDESNNYVRGLW